LDDAGLSFLLASVVLAFSIVVFIVSIILRFWYKMKINMTFGSLGIFVIASWIFTDSYLCPIVFGVDHINGILNYMLCFMIPFAPALYLNSVQGGKYKKGMSIIMIIASLNAITWPLLHFTGLVPFYNIRNIGNLILAFMSVFSIGILIHDAIRGDIRGYRYTFIGFGGFLICGIIELTLLLIPFITWDSSIPVVIGLAFLLTFVVVQQIDDLRKINIEKQHAIDISEAKTRFLANMSHEIRTPINAILGMNEMILRENNDKIIDEYSRSIKTSGKMLLMLVNDVLDFSKIEAGKLEINETRFLLSEMLYDILSIVKERADEKTLELKTEITAEIPNEVISDEFRIRQILVNLVNNAVKYTDKGSVTILVGGCYIGENGYQLSLRVRDTGRGIRKEEQSYLFDAFSRADAKANANIEGTGLGLAIVKSIVDSMHGTLGVVSEYGSGSEFWVNIPVKYSNKTALKNDMINNRSYFEQTKEKESFLAPKANILAVDDNQSNLTIVKLFLKRTKINLDLCNNGKRAIELCREKKYDLILLDHMMPKPDGIETLHIIREDEKSLNRDTKAVVLTANAIAGSRQMYINEGFEDYLTKPLDSKVLEQTIKDMLPKDKIVESVDDIEELKEGEQHEKISPIKKKLSSIEGLDYNIALGHCCGDEEILTEIIADISADAPKRSERMRKSLEAKDIKSYEIDAHSIKSTMATIGLMSLSERAKRHEYASKDNNTGFIAEDAEGFINEYTEVCRKLGEG